MNPEQLLYTRIRDNLGHEWDTQRIESTIGRGIPDITTCHRSTGEIWIEAKAGPNPLKPRLRPEQYAWAKRRAHFGGRCCVITQDKAHNWLFWPINDHTKFGSVGSYMVPNAECVKLTTSSNLDTLFLTYYANTRPSPDSPSGSNSSP